MDCLIQYEYEISSELYLCKICTFSQVCYQLAEQHTVGKNCSLLEIGILLAGRVLLTYRLLIATDEMALFKMIYVVSFS